MPGRSQDVGAGGITAGGAYACVASLLDRRIENELQAQTFGTLRDTLLPRLISGQLRLPEAEVLAAET